MNRNTWLRDILEEETYKYYLENYPKMVDGIKKLIIAGESTNKIKDHCEVIVGKSMTSRCVGFMVDYVNRQIKN